MAIKEKNFSKLIFDYEVCSDCSSLYHSPRYEEKNFKLFYKNGKSVKYWSTNFYKKTSKSRIKFLWIPKIKLIKKIIKNKNIKITNLIDIGSGYGDFLNLAKKKKFVPIQLELNHLKILIKFTYKINTKL